MATNTDDGSWIEVDDSVTNSNLVYSGEWIKDAYDKPGSSTAPGDLNHGTAHGTVDGSFSFHFEGQELMALGVASKLPETADYDVDCKIDGKPAKVEAVDPASLEWRLCVSEKLTPGPHDVLITIKTKNNLIVWLDTIAYLSTPNAPLNGTFTTIEPTDPLVNYEGNGWHEGGVRYADSLGSTVKVPFTGTSIEVRGLLEPNMPRTPSSASYSIDGATSVPFNIPAYVDNYRGLPSNASRVRVPILETPTLPYGNHTLIITYLGSAETVPLALDYFVVNHGVSDSTDPGKSTNRAMIGGLVGGAALVTLGAAFFLRRKRRNDEHRFQQMDDSNSIALFDSGAGYPPSHTSGRNQVYHPVGYDDPFAEPLLVGQSIPLKPQHAPL